jgi:zinc transport system ATP-binding protein
MIYHCVVSWPYPKLLPPFRKTQDINSSLMPDTAVNDTPLLRVNQINLRFAERHILQDVNLQVARGRIVTLIGPNGAGKTTLVRVILGLLQPESGAVLKSPGLKIGYMPQKLRIESTMPMSVERFLGLSGIQDKAIIKKHLDELDISHLADQQLHGVSGGELQRVLLCRALLRQPDLLILDEPAQGVDVTGQAQLYELISATAAQNGCGVLMVSHDLHLVMSATDEVICLNHHICCHGKPEHVSNDPAYLALFGKHAVDNLAVYTHNHNHHHDLMGNVVEPSGEND